MEDQQRPDRHRPHHHPRGDAGDRQEGRKLTRESPRGGPTRLEDCRALDARDPLRSLRERFARGSGDAIYLDGNSIGAMPADAPARLQRLMEQGWRDLRRRSWNALDWLEKPRLLGAACAHIVGAAPEDVVFCDSTSVNLFKLLGYAAQLNPARPAILAESYAFPTDLYVAEGLARFSGGRTPLRLIDSPEALEGALSPDVGVLCLSLVDYRSSRRWNMAAVNAIAARAGVLTLWDLSHAAGAIDIDLAGTGADFAVSCGYKYLCGGPGAPALLYVNPRHQARAWPVIAGWMGHADTFRFSPDFEPAPGVRRHLVGSPAVLANEAMAAAADIWKDVPREALAGKHRSLSELAMTLLAQECGTLGVTLASPGKYEERGGHVAFSHPGASAVMEALLERGVVCSFRKPDAIRFGLSPVALSHEDLWSAVSRLREVLASGAWREPKYQRASV